MPQSQAELTPHGLAGLPLAAGRRWPSVVCAGAVVLALYTVAIVGLRLTDTRWVVGYTIAVSGLFLGRRLLGSRVSALREALQRERTLLARAALLCAVAYPFLAADPYQMHVVTMGGIFALMALGLNVTVGFAGLADFGYVAYYAIGAYTSALLNVRFGVNFWIAAPLAGATASVFSLLVGFPAIRVKGHYLALVTLGFAFIVVQLITNLEPVTGGTQGVSGIAAPALFGHSFQAPLRIGPVELPYQANFYFVALALVAAAAMMCVRLARSRWGRAWIAMQSDELAAQSSGLDIVKLKLVAFCTGASFGGVAGAFYAHMMSYIDPSSFRFIDSVFLLAIVAIGNWRVAGVIAAALLVTVLPEKLRAFEEWRLMVFSIVLLVVMLVRGRHMVVVLR